MSVTFRRATWQDTDLLLDWRNDPLTRKNSRETRVFTRDEYIEKRLSGLFDGGNLCLIAQAAGDPVAVVMARRCASATELSWTVAPRHRGKGYGCCAVRTVVQHLPRPLVAIIKADNPASQHIATNAGFQLIRSEGDLQIWQIDGKDCVAGSLPILPDSEQPTGMPDPATGVAWFDFD
jgi:RimJ/RimL family protein N-acetyltransferase